jgi:hypothetical protein
MDTSVILTPYQKTLAERSLVTEPSEYGEYWEFRWYIDPLCNGLSKWVTITAHVSDEYGIRIIGGPLTIDEEELSAQEQAAQFVEERYRRYGLAEQEDWD